jgi:outer membrane protein assembly factor BamB
MGSARLSTGVIKDDKVYLINMTGIGECLDLKTGEQVGKARIRHGQHGKPVWGACVLVGDKIYAVDKQGVTFVLKADPTFEVISANPLGEASNCTLAFSNGEIFIRTENALWCIAEGEDA